MTMWNNRVEIVQQAASIWMYLLFYTELCISSTLLFIILKKIIFYSKHILAKDGKTKSFYQIVTLIFKTLVISWKV